MAVATTVVLLSDADRASSVSAIVNVVVTVLPGTTWCAVGANTNALKLRLGLRRVPANVYVLAGGVRPSNQSLEAGGELAVGRRSAGDRVTVACSLALSGSVIVTLENGLTVVLVDPLSLTSLIAWAVIPPIVGELLTAVATTVVVLSDGGIGAVGRRDRERGRDRVAGNHLMCTESGKTRARVCSFDCGFVKPRRAAKRHRSCLAQHRSKSSPRSRQR